jgi:hypothetical protein
MLSSDSREFLSARQQHATDLDNVGSELRDGKAEAYGLTPEGRAQIPYGIKQPSAIWTDRLRKWVMAL